MQPHIVAHNVSKTFISGGESVAVLQGIDLEIFPGEFIGLVGPSGCGKSTLLNIIGLAERASSGAVIIGGVEAHAASEGSLRVLRRTKLGYVFQQFNLLSTLSALENVMVPLVIHGVAVQEAEDRARELLERVGLGHRLTAMPYSLSGGEMQRVAIARAVIHQPLVILADEPTGSLDSHAGEQVLELLHEESARGVAILMATHSDHAIARCSRIVRIKDGAIQR